MDHGNQIKTAFAHASVNIALLKYWGKKDEKLKIPFQSSISLTLNELYSETKITLDSSLTNDVLFLNGSRAATSDEQKLQTYLDLVRKIYQQHGFLKIESQNFVPTAAGLASSASAYASIALALNEVYNLGLDQKAVSSLARLGSGSASRSIFGGFNIWHHGYNHETSYAEKIPSDWDNLALIVVLISDKKKGISSREAMKKSLSRPSYQKFVADSTAMVPLVLTAIKEKDLKQLGPLIEKSSDLLHATIRDSGIDYYLPETYAFLEQLKLIKAEYDVYYTLDAGPNVKLLTTVNNIEAITKRLQKYETLVCTMGRDGYVRT